MALADTEVMHFLLKDLVDMQKEFLEIYEKLFADSQVRLRRALQLKLKAMALCEQKDEEEQI